MLFLVNLAYSFIRVLHYSFVCFSFIRVLYTLFNKQMQVIIIGMGGVQHRLTGSWKSDCARGCTTRSLPDAHQVSKISGIGSKSSTFYRAKNFKVIILVGGTRSEADMICEELIHETYYLLSGFKHSSYYNSIERIFKFKNFTIWARAAASLKAVGPWGAIENNL